MTTARAEPGGAVLEDFATLEGWTCLDGAGGAFASFKPADSTPPGAPGALQGRFPGILYKELTSDQIKDSEAWNAHAGLSFWVKGDGSSNSGCLAIGPAGAKSWEQGFGSSSAHATYFPLKDTNWHQVSVGWHDFVPEETQPAIGAPDGLAPADIRVLRLGNRWFHHQPHPEEPRPGRHYAVGQIRFVTKAPPVPAVPPLPPIAGVLEKLRKKQPVRIQVMGDSITAGHSVEVYTGERYSDRLGKLLKSAYGYDAITVVNRAVCGARIADARGWVARDFADLPPDLLIFMYGTNDSVVCTPDEFARMLEEYLDRVAVATGGKTAVLPLTTIPGAFARFASTDPFAQQVRAVALRRGLAYCDTHAVFKELGFHTVKMMMISSLVHPNAEGHELIAKTVAHFLTNGPPPVYSNVTPDKVFSVVANPGAAVPPAPVAAALNFIEPFKETEYAAAHVQGTSYPMPQDFVDCPWQGILAASDGKTYFFVSSHVPGHAAQFYRFDLESRTVKHLADVGAWCNDPLPAEQRPVQHVVRANLFEHQGKLYAVTSPVQSASPRRYPGGHFLAYTLATGKLEDLAMVADPDSRWGFAAAALDPRRERLYALHQQGMLYYFDLKTGAVVEAGRLEAEGCEWQPRTLVCDSNGVVYGGGLKGDILRYDPEANTVSTLQIRAPHDPSRTQPSGPSSVDNAAWEATRWERLVWDPVGAWWYGVRGNDEYLGRFRPSADAQAATGTAEGLGSFAYPGKKARNGSLGLALLGRRLYYATHAAWSSMAHLMSYDLDTGAFTHHGPLIVEDGRRVCELQSLLAGAGGKLHGVAMVWSLSEKDPAPAGAIRGKWNFHPRFVIIDPDKDFHLPKDQATQTP